MKAGDKVNVLSHKDTKEVFTVALVYNEYWYSLDPLEVAHFYFEDSKYENIYFVGELKPV